MQINEINPFLRDAEMQLSILEGGTFRAAYDYRIFYIICGKAQILFEHENHTLSEGDLIFFRPGIPYYWSGKCQGIVLNFDLSQKQSNKKQPLCPTNIKQFDRKRIFEDDPPDALENIIFAKGRPDLKPRFVELVSCYSIKNELSDVRASAILKELLCELIDSIQPPNQYECLVGKIIGFIKQNCTRKITNSEIAAHIGYNPLYCNRIFLQVTGCTIHNYVLHERLNIALRLLRETDLSIEQVAFETGFHDRSYFCTAFKAMTGATPAAYRKSILAVEQK